MLGGRFAIMDRYKLELVSAGARAGREKCLALRGFEPGPGRARGGLGPPSAARTRLPRAAP